jgi:hypothetical protein
MKSIAIHIGLHKAASTYLQSQIFSQTEANYVFVSGYKREYLELVQSPDRYDPETFRCWVSAEIQKTADQPTYALTILSHEELSGHPHGYDIVNPTVVAENLQRTFPNAKIILIVRNQFSYLRSIYTFRVAIKGQEPRCYEKFLAEEGRLGLFEKLDYHKLVEPYISLFGQDKVLVLPVELLKEDFERFNRTITDFLGVPPVLLEQAAVVNPSTKSSLIIQFWRPFNFLFAALLALLERLQIETKGEYPFEKLRYTYYEFKQKVTGVLNSLLKSTKQVGAEKHIGYDDLVQRYAASNTQLQAYVGVDLAAYGYPISEQ